MARTTTHAAPTLTRGRVDLHSERVVISQAR
jgi:hypothetical protein